MSEPPLSVVSGSGLPPTIIRELMDVGPLFRPIERNLARVPSLFTHGAVQQSLGLDVVEHAPVLYKRTVSITGDRLTPHDQLFVAEVTNSWILSGCSSDLLVPIDSWAATVRWRGYKVGPHGPNGQQRADVLATIQRARGLTITSHVMVNGKPRLWVWGIFADGDLPLRDDGTPAYITLDRRYAQLIRERSVSFGNVEVHRRLLRRDPIAAHLWAFLEVEQGPGQPGQGFHYPLFASAPGRALHETQVPAIADLLGLHNHAHEQPCPSHKRAMCSGCHPKVKRHRRDVTRRIREAVRNIIKEDPDYSASEVSSGRGIGMWNLDAKRVRHHDSNGATTPRSARGPRPDRRADHDSNGAFEHTKRKYLNASKETNVVSSSLTRTSPILEALTRKGWKRPSSKQLTAIQEIANRRELGNDEQVADIIIEHYPGRASADLFRWLGRDYRKPSRPIRTIDDITEPPPLLPLGEIA